MKISVLGTGSCYGVPTIGGDWGECDPGNPKNRRTVASIMVESGKSKILIDLSPDFREQSLGHDVTDLDAILFTHGHADHILGNFYLPRLLQYYKGKTVPLYADPVAQRDIERMFWFQMGEGGQVNFSYGGKTHWETIKPFQKFTIGDLTVLPLPQMHGPITSFTFRIGDFAYSTDFDDFPPETMERLQGLKCWILECNRKDRKEGSGHLYLEKSLEFIEKVKPEKVYLTHLNVTMDHDKISAILPGHVHLAYDGLEITL